jgi:hypothetical protein
MRFADFEVTCNEISQTGINWPCSGDLSLLANKGYIMWWSVMMYQEEETPHTRTSVRNDLVANDSQ